MAEEERKRQQQLKEEQQRQAELERQRQKALELERERERAVQQAMLQREAEVREAERKRKEEWAKRRLVELEEERKKEKEGLMSLKNYHQELMEQLTKLELEKRTYKLRLEQHRLSCTELAKSVDELRYNYSNSHNQLLQSVSEVKVSFNG